MTTPMYIYLDTKSILVELDMAKNTPGSTF